MIMTCKVIQLILFVHAMAFYNGIAVGGVSQSFRISPTQPPFPLGHQLQSRKDLRARNIIGDWKRRYCTHNRV